MSTVEHMTAADLRDHVEAMPKGDSVVYFTGHLGEEAVRSAAVSQLRDMAQRLSTMWMASPTGQIYNGMGMIALSQRRVERGFNYLARRL